LAKPLYRELRLYPAGQPGVSGKALWSLPYEPQAPDIREHRVTMKAIEYQALAFIPA